MRVQINAGGREVTIDCADTNVSVREVAAEALGVWAATEGAKVSEGPAFGMAASEIGSGQTATSAMHTTPGIAR